MIGRLLVAALLAYVPPSTSLFKRAAARGERGRGREVTLSGTLDVTGEKELPAQLVLKFPLSCRLERQDGVALSVRGTPDRPAATAEGTSGPALTLLRLACPLIAYRGLPRASAEEALRAAAVSSGTDVTSATSFGRLGDRVAYVVGAPQRDLSRPQLWLYKDSHAPARLIADGGADLRLLEYGSPAAAEWFPRVLELWESGRLRARFEVLQAKGARGTTDEEESEDSGRSE